MFHGLITDIKYFSSLTSSLFCAKRSTIRSRPGSNVVRLVTLTHSLCAPSTTTYFPSSIVGLKYFFVGLKYFILFCLNIGVLYRKMERSSTNTKNYKPPLSNINLFERPDTDFERAKGIVSWPAEFLVVNFVFYLYSFIIILHYCLCYFVMRTLVARVFVNTVYNVFHPRYFEKRPLEPRLV